MRAIDSTKVIQCRRDFLGGSDARVVMGGDAAALLRLWKEKRGEMDQRISRGTCWSSSAPRPNTSTGPGMSAKRGSRSRTFSAGFSTRAQVDGCDS